MHDRRVMRGSTYAAMVIPAGTNPDAMVMEKTQAKKRTFRKTGQVSSLFELTDAGYQENKEHLPQQRHSDPRSCARSPAH